MFSPPDKHLGLLRYQEYHPPENGNSFDEVPRGALVVVTFSLESNLASAH